MTGNLVWVSRIPFDGHIPEGVNDVDGACVGEAQSDGIGGSIVAWFSAGGRGPMQQSPSQPVPSRPQTAPWSRKTSPTSSNCTKGGGKACLLAPIDRDIIGLPMPAGTLTWTGTLPNGTASGSPNCDGWLSTSPGATGNGGSISRDRRGLDPWQRRQLQRAAHRDLLSGQ